MGGPGTTAYCLVVENPPNTSCKWLTNPEIEARQSRSAPQRQELPNFLPLCEASLAGYILDATTPVHDPTHGLAGVVIALLHQNI